MGRELTHSEVRELLGAYALDAVDDNERSAVDSHLESCVPCQTEVWEHREVASLLASGWIPAPEGLWDRIAGSLEEAPPPMRMPSNVVPLDAERSRRRQLGAVWRGLAAVGVAASVALMGLIGIKVLDTSDRVNDVAAGLQYDDIGRVAEAAAADPRARKVTLRSVAGNLSADAVILPDGTGYLVKANLPRLPEERTYQLWAVVADRAISVGVLGPSPGPAAFHASGNVSALAITEEISGGVVASKQQPTVVGTLA